MPIVIDCALIEISAILKLPYSSINIICLAFCKKVS
jgi:hypothetical protein